MARLVENQEQKLPTLPRASRACGRIFPTSTGFTLVELLVVIGIIALLISILLPALNKARKQTLAAQCLSNEHSIGLAMSMYTNDNQGAIIPCQFWKGSNNPASPVDAWPFALVVGKYLPDPRAQFGQIGPAVKGTVLVCPSVRDQPTGTIGNADTAAYDGYDRLASVVLAPATNIPNPEPVTNGALGAMVIDVGYACNGTVSGIAGPATIPMQGMDVTRNPAFAYQFNPVNRITKFRKPSQTVVLLDGFQWDLGFGIGTPKMLGRIGGSRHGNWNAGKPFTSGVCNVLFLDGHCAPVNRVDLPSDGATGPAQIKGSGAVVLNNTYIWNSAQ